MTNAFIDTTILTDALLKTGPERATARSALARYQRTALPVYAIKELQYGPLRAFRYFHNKLVTTRSLVGTFRALQSLSRSQQRNLLSTALEALATAQSLVSKRIPDEMLERHQSGKSRDEIEADELRLATLQVIRLAWRKRRKITSEVLQPLPCFLEKEPTVTRGLIDGSTSLCTPATECCFANQLRQRRPDLLALQAAIEAQPTKPENERRLKVIKELLKGRPSAMTEGMCRNLGDAYFALYCPTDSKILTTNIGDHAPLAAALGREAEAP